MPSLTAGATVTDPEPANPRHVNAAAHLLALSVHESIRGLVPYHATGYGQYLKAALEPPASLRTVLIRVVVVDGVPVGAADWRILPDSLFLNGIAVFEHARGMGLARRLVVDGLAIADSMGLHRLGLDVVTENSVAMSFYRRMGFVITGESYWHDVAPPVGSSPASAARALDWPAFRAHVTAYGFGDLNVRDCDGKQSRTRQVGGNLRIDEAGSRLGWSAYFATLGATRVFTTTPHPTADACFSRSARMVRG